MHYYKDKNNACKSTFNSIDYNYQVSSLSLQITLGVFPNLPQDQLAPQHPFGTYKTPSSSQSYI